MMSLALLPATSFAADPNEFLVWNYDQLNDGSPELRGRLFVPTDYDPSQSYPLVIFYHGLGEVGTNNTGQVNGNINNLLAAAKSRGFFLYAPQTPSGWNAGTIRSSMRMAANAREAYNIDSSKVYVTGLSLGGGATWLAVSTYPGSMAAAVPICGVSAGTGFRPNDLTAKPIWAFHAANDGTVGVGTSRSAVNGILSARPEPTINFNTAQSGSPYYTGNNRYYDKGTLRYTEYASGGHGIWGTVYNESWMYDWLLAQTVDPLMLTGDELIFDFGNTEIANPDSQSRQINGTPYGLHATLGAVIPFAHTTNGRSTGTWISIETPFAGHVTGGISAGSPFDAGVADDGWITPIQATEQNGAGLMLLQGLMPGGEYRVEIFASSSNDDGGRGRSTRYKISGQEQNLDAALNTTGTAVFETVSADTQGVLEVRVFPNPDSSSRYGQINTLQLTFLQGPDGPVNSPPSVSAGSDKSLIMTLGNTVQTTLVGVATDDGLPEPASLTTEWTVVSAPAGASVQFDSPTSPSTMATFDAPGEYLLQVQADDSERTATDTVLVTVNLQGGPLGGLALFSQNFGSTASTDLSPYINPVNPNIGQFDDLGTVDSSSSWYINADGNLEHDRSAGNATQAGFTRTTPLGNDVQFSRVEFQVGLSGTNAYTDMVVLDFGSTIGTSGYDGGISSVTIAYRMVFKANGSGNWYIRMYGNHDSPLIPSDGALHDVVWYMNKSGVDKTYNGPDGFGHVLPTGTSDLWLDGVKVLVNIAESTSYTASTMSEFRLRTGTSQPIVMKLENFQYFNQDASPPAASPYQDFLDTYFNETEQLDDSISGLFVDEDEDGLKNLFEYAFVLNPRVDTPFDFVSVSENSSRLVASFQRAPSRTDVTLELWGTNSLTDEWDLLASSTDGQPFVDHTGGALLISESGTETKDVEIQDVDLTGAPAQPTRFLQLRAVYSVPE
ncbi:MAG: hypothetical protein PF795_04160 [Kiritimatiellae bacterium]|nr:hypothetical protein [Kiritimatiellia bacterium]